MKSEQANDNTERGYNTPKAQGKEGKATNPVFCPNGVSLSLSLYARLPPLADCTHLDNLHRHHQR
jgi:hypothetical protein